MGDMSKKMEVMSSGCLLFYVLYGIGKHFGFPMLIKCCVFLMPILLAFSLTVISLAVYKCKNLGFKVIFRFLVNVIGMLILFFLAISENCI